MSVNALLSTIVLVSFIVTVVLAVGSYMAYKIREGRRPPATLANLEGEPVFFERVYPGGGAARLGAERADDRPDAA
jgi:hypothetical protein